MNLAVGASRHLRCLYAVMDPDFTGGKVPAVRQWSRIPHREFVVRTITLHMVTIGRNTKSVFPP